MLPKESNLITSGLDLDTLISSSIESFILKHREIKIIIFDNITYLLRENDKAKKALPLMQNLTHLKKKYGLSILVIGHTPKRDMSRVLTINDLAGSKTLMNFCDSSFAIGKSKQDEQARYIKQIKESATEKIYGTDNVIVCELNNDDKNFINFKFKSYGDERDHVGELENSKRRERDDKIVELSTQGLNQRQIADELSVSVGTVNKVLKKAEVQKGEEK